MRDALLGRGQNVHSFPLALPDKSEPWAVARWKCLLSAAHSGLPRSIGQGEAQQPKGEGRLRCDRWDQEEGEEEKQESCQVAERRQQREKEIG